MVERRMGKVEKEGREGNEGQTRNAPSYQNKLNHPSIRVRDCYALGHRRSLGLGRLGDGLLDPGRCKIRERRRSEKVSSNETRKSTEVSL